VYSAGKVSGQHPVGRPEYEGAGSGFAPRQGGTIQRRLACADHHDVSTLECPWGRQLAGVEDLPRETVDALYPRYAGFREHAITEDHVVEIVFVQRCGGPGRPGVQPEPGPRPAVPPGEGVP
jgi:hypothetical protein